MKKEREVYADMDSAINRLKNNGLQIDTGAREIAVPWSKRVGIKLWGAIDYLKNKHKYIWYHV